MPIADCLGRWGFNKKGDWSDPDYPHFQMRHNDEIASIRETSTVRRATV